MAKVELLELKLAATELKVDEINTLNAKQQKLIADSEKLLLRQSSELERLNYENKNLLLQLLMQEKKADDSNLIDELKKIVAATPAFTSKADDSNKEKDTLNSAETVNSKANINISNRNSDRQHTTSRNRQKNM